VPAGSLDWSLFARFVFFSSFCWTGVSVGLAVDDDVLVVVDVDVFVPALLAWAGFVGFDPCVDAVVLEP